MESEFNMGEIDCASRATYSRKMSLLKRILVGDVPYSSYLAHVKSGKSPSKVRFPKSKVLFVSMNTCMDSHE